MEKALLLRGAHVSHFHVLEDRFDIALDAVVPNRHLGEERKLPPFDIKTAVSLKNLAMCPVSAYDASQSRLKMSSWYA